MGLPIFGIGQSRHNAQIQPIGEIIVFPVMQRQPPCTEGQISITWCRSSVSRAITIPIP